MYGHNKTCRLPGPWCACGKTGNQKDVPECTTNIFNNYIRNYFVNFKISTIYGSSVDTESDTGELILNKKFKVTF